MDKRMIAALLAPEAYDEPTASVSLIETHVSYLFLTDHHVYKIKKSVDLGFLNFTSLDRRRFYCNEEVRLNSRLCPWIYKGVAEVREGREGIRIGKEGRIVEYAVKMLRLPEIGMLDRLLEQDEVEQGTVRSIAAVVAQFHAAAERGKEINSYGSPDRIQHNWNENILQLEKYKGFTLDPNDYDLVSYWGERYLTENRGDFERRVRDGFIRDCDGDLHAENICVTDRICIFDCIEFNPSFRFSDTSADIAFLLMDFDYYLRPDLGEAFLDEYVRWTGDKGAASLLLFYKVFRALVRGKVESLRATGPSPHQRVKKSDYDKACRYFKLARGYCVREKIAPTIIITCGLMGSGKSSTVAELALQTGIGILSSDRTRKSIAGVPHEEHHFDPYGVGLYAPESDEVTYKALLELAEGEVTKGKSVIIDATFRRRRFRHLFRLLSQRAGVKFRIINITCPEQLVRKRLLDRAGRTAEVSDGRWELYSAQKEQFELPDVNEGDQIFIDSSFPLHDNVDKILKELGAL